MGEMYKLPREAIQGTGQVPPLPAATDKVPPRPMRHAFPGHYSYDLLLPW